MTLEMTPHAQLLAAADFINTALLDLSASTSKTARHVILERRDFEHAEDLLERAVRLVNEATAQVYGGPRELADVAGEVLDREQLAVLDAALEVRAP